MNKSALYQKAKACDENGDLKNAYRYYLEASLSEDDGAAMYALGEMYLCGDYVDRDFGKAGRYYGMAYDRGAEVDPMRMIYAGYYSEEKDKSPDNLQDAIRYFQAAVDLGCAYGHDCLGKVYYTLGEYEKAYEHLLQMEGDSPLGYYYLGRLYDEGHAVEQDRERAIELYHRTIAVCLHSEDQYGEDEDCHKARARLDELGVEHK